MLVNKKETPKMTDKFRPSMDLQTTLKKILLPILFLITAVCLLLSADESRTPLTLKGDALTREAGSIDGTCVRIAEDSGFSGTFLRTKNFMLEKGSYRIGVEYHTDTETNTLSLYDNGRTTDLAILSPQTTYEEYPFTLTQDSQDAVLKINYSGVGNLSVDSVTLIPESRFYNDTYFYAFLVLVIGAAVIVLFQTSYWKRLDIRTKAIGFALLGIALAAFVPYMNGYLNWGDDLCYHLIRIEGIKDGLLDGQFPVVIYPEGMQGNGYLNCMYPNLFLYLPAILRLMGVSMAGSYKCLVLVFHLLTVGITYFSVKSICGSRKAALLAAILYTLCPYRLTNFYARGAVGEALAMTFFPLLLAGLYHVLLGDTQKYWMLVLGLSGLIQTHVLSALLGTVFCILPGIVCIHRVFAEKRILPVCKVAALTLLLNLWFLVPFLYFYTKEGLYTEALDWCSFSEYSLNLSGLAGTINTTDYRTLTLGLPVVFCAVLALFYFVLERGTSDAVDAETSSKAPGALSLFTGFLLILGAASTFMVLNQFPGWEFLRIGLYEKFLKNLQFAWRMLGPASVTLIFTGCILLYQSRLLAPYRQGIFIALTAVCLLSAVHYQPEDFAYASYDSTYSRGHLSKINGIPKGESTIVYPYEWCLKDFPVTEPDTDCTFAVPDAISDAACSRTGTTTTLTYRNSLSGNTVTFPVMAYSGYAAEDENGNPLPLIENKDKKIAVELSADTGSPHQIIVKYKGMAGFTIALIISLATAVIWAAAPKLKQRIKAKAGI